MRRALLRAHGRRALDRGPDVPARAVADREELVLGELGNVGVAPARPVLYGAWCGLDYQDIVVCRRG